MRETPMPRSTVRYHGGHGLDQWEGDCPRAVRAAAALPVGSDAGRFIDINLQRTANGDIGVHSGTPRVSGWRYIVRRSRLGRRRLTDEELDRNYRGWTDAETLRLRRTKRLGLSYESRVRLRTFKQLTRLCKRLGVTPCYELKSPAYAGEVTHARDMVDYHRSLGITVYYMTLAAGQWRAKVINFHAAGAQIALLAHGLPKPRDLAEYRVYVTRVWGSWG